MSPESDFTEADPAPVSDPTILVVDDSSEARDSIEAALVDVEGTVLLANSGEDALRVAMDCDDLAVIVLDVTMPGMSGFEVAEMLRQRPRFSGTPIVFMTGVAMEQHQVFHGYELGAVDYIFKPVDPHIIRSKVSVFVELRRQREQLQRLSETLELRVKERTAELVATNKALQAEIVERKAAEEAKAKLQDQLLHKERLAAIGTTAATFAHEVGNPLNSMYLQAQMLERQFVKRGQDADEPMRKRLKIIMGEMERLTGLLNEFRSLSRRRDYLFEPTRINELVGDTLRAHAPAFEAQGVTLVQELSPESATVMADRDKLTQAFVNLCKNAVEAMPGGGTLTVRIASSGGTARLEIEDTGVGIPEGVEIFEPFATTKAEGTGLGLPVVRQIVDAHDGMLNYRSKQGAGTTFEIALPFAAEDAEPRTSASAIVG
jgi:signal transduction histidine kinase